MCERLRLVVYWTVAVAACVSGATETALAQSQSIVLRDLTLLENVTITALDADGLRLTLRTNADEQSNRTIRWHEVLKGNVDTAWQADFDTMRSTIGETSFQLRLRLQRKEFTPLCPLCDRLLKLADAHAASGYTRYLASAAEVRCRLDQNDHIAGVEPLFSLLSIREAVGQDDTIESIGGVAQIELAEIDALCELRFSSEGLCLPLLPVWSDTDRDSLQALILDDRPPPGDAGALYWFSLAIAQGQSLDWDQIEIDAPWQYILAAQSALIANSPDEAIDQLANLESDGAAEIQAIALYYRGLAEWQRHQRRHQRQVGEQPDDDAVAMSNRHGWLLYWLAIPANHQSKLGEFSRQVLRDARNRIDGESDSDLHRRLTDLVRQAERPPR